MSGPKVSVYELSAWERQNLREQLKCEQQNFTCVEEIKQLIFYLNGLGGQVESLLSTFSLINARIADYSIEINGLRDIKTGLEQNCSLFTTELSANMPVSSNKITLSDEALNEKKILLSKLKSIKTKVTENQKKMELVLSEMNTKAQFGADEIKSEIADDIAAISSFNIESNENNDEQFTISRKKLEDKLRALSVSSECPIAVKPKLLETLSSLMRITNAEYLRTYP